MAHSTEFRVLWRQDPPRGSAWPSFWRGYVAGVLRSGFKPVDSDLQQLELDALGTAVDCGYMGA